MHRCIIFFRHVGNKGKVVVANFMQHISELAPLVQAAMLTYKVFHDTAPRYLDRVADIPGRRAIRSASTSRLVVPSFRLSTVGCRTFNVSAPRIWNALPEDVVTINIRALALNLPLPAIISRSCYLTVHLAP